MQTLDQNTDDPALAPPVEDTERDEERDEEDEITCAACGQAITRPKFRTSVGGAFQHACVNPAGILFEIGCFKEAEGCRELGAESDDFSWFPGFTWQVAVCGQCKTHLGWRFWSPEDEFYGLILKKLA